jgi:hypothetical protein
MKCQACKADLLATARFCNHCGAEVRLGKQPGTGGDQEAPESLQEDDRPLARIGQILLVLLIVVWVSWYLWYQWMGNGASNWGFTLK